MTAYIPETTWKKYFSDQTYTLDYKNKYLTLEQAKKEISKINNLKVKKKDYKKLLWDKKVKNIPQIYKHIPKDSIFFDIKNPQFLLSFIKDPKNNQAISAYVWLIKKSIWEKQWDLITKNLKHNVIVVFNDLDLVSPNFLIIIDKKDEDALSVWARTLAAKSVWDKIYISWSKELLENYLNLDEKDSIYYADDFQYVWYKKQDKKKDLFFFAWDSFFEKITSLEYYLKMRRKINDYQNLKKLQEYVFALQKIRWEKINNFSALEKMIKLDKNKIKDFSVKNSIVKNKNVW